MESLRHPEEEHYVYLYRDDRDCILYVGCGGKPERASSHQIESHNGELSEFLSKNNYRIEIAGPYGNESSARAVEAALISTLNPKFNISPGSSRLRFRPLGVPTDFAERLTEPKLDLKDFLAAQGPDPTQSYS